MTKKKRMVLILTIFTTMLIALVVGLAELNVKKQFNIPTISESFIGDTGLNKDEGLTISSNKTTYSFENAEIVAGSSKINFEYEPDINSKASNTKVYEYVFSNPMSEDMAISLESDISISGVTVSFDYSDARKESIVSGTYPFEIQDVQSGQTKYIYIILTAQSSTNFTTDIIWCQGKLGIVSINALTASAEHKIVRGQMIAQPEAPEVIGHTFKGWYYDAKYEQSITFPIRSEGQTLYAKLEDHQHANNGKTEGKYVLYGSYPQNYVGNSLNSTLLTELNAGRLQATAKKYTTDINNTTKVLQEYIYNNEYYAYLDSAATYSSYNFNSDGNTSVAITNGGKYFFKVQPLRWENNNGTYVCEFAVGSMRFDSSSNVWKNTEMRRWLNEVFYYESGIFEIKKQTSTVQNNTASNINDGSGESTQDYIWIPSYNELNAWYGLDNERRKSVTDMAVSTYAWAGTGNTVCWTRSVSDSSYVYRLDYNGLLVAGDAERTVKRTDYSVIPCFSLADEITRSQEVYATNGTTDSEGYVLYGAYPQDYVGNTLNTTLLNKLNEGSLQQTGRTYITNAYYDDVVLLEYKYNGEYYAYLDGAKTYTYYASLANYTFITEPTTEIIEDGKYFFKVQPLRWKIYNGIYLCEYGIGCRKFGDEGISLWQNSDVRSWLNTTFYYDAGLNQIISNKVTISNNSTTNTADGSGVNTSDYVWLPSYTDVNSTIFKTDEQRLAGCSDLNLATMGVYNTIYSATTYWTRSATSSTQAYYVGGDGVIRSYNVPNTTMACRPCFKI